MRAKAESSNVFPLHGQGKHPATTNVGNRTEYRGHAFTSASISQHRHDMLEDSAIAISFHDRGKCAIASDRREAYHLIQHSSERSISMPAAVLVAYRKEQVQYTTAQERMQKFTRELSDRWNIVVS